MLIELPIPENPRVGPHDCSKLRMRVFDKNLHTTQASFIEECIFQRGESVRFEILKIALLVGILNRRFQGL